MPDVPTSIPMNIIAPIPCRCHEVQIAQYASQANAHYVDKKHSDVKNTAV
ncbi:hypothetical protein GWA01_21930 [Gluconobacter wancherniae NBRC 103581]|uniref:Uncharacterized protein n=1 Tax=Gluconobacter wancherniae NBRC 103581 TaxID=656744 RepID=A0A511B419_9PROT|nr:hypothetical protein GWA01_21930 [Gluconobacter wancherniae NBRC 103581]